MKKTSLTAVLAFILAMIVPAGAVAASITFSSESSFLGATSSSGPFDAPGSAVTTGPLTFSYISVSPGAGATAMGVSNLLNTSLPTDLGVAGDNDYSNLNFALSVQATAFGFTVSSTGYEYSPQDSIFEVKLYSGGGFTLLDTASFTALASPGADIDTFFGIKSSAAFDFVTVREMSGGVQRGLHSLGYGPIDQEFFGQFYVEKVPEPATVLLIGSGLAGLGLVRRRLTARKP